MPVRDARGTDACERTAGEQVDYQYDAAARINFVTVTVVRAKDLPRPPAGSAGRGGQAQAGHVAVVELGGEEVRSPPYEGQHPEWNFPATFVGFDLQDPLVVKILRCGTVRSVRGVLPSLNFGRL